ncbi:MAG: hypothetical protein ACKOJF_11280 [Planctomycetaceae bacterium]
MSPPTHPTRATGDFLRFDAVAPLVLRLHRETGVESELAGHGLLLRSTVAERDRAGLSLVEPRREYLVAPGVTLPGEGLLPGDELVTGDGDWIVMTATLRPRVGLWHCVCQPASPADSP